MLKAVYVHATFVVRTHKFYNSTPLTSSLKLTRSCERIAILLREARAPWATSAWRECTKRPSKYGGAPWRRVLRTIYVENRYN